MGMLRFCDDPPRIYEVPRLEDNLIDELFYQEDEIGEMRHTAFMIECGLEEDPPDGPDVPPIPWKFSPGKARTGAEATTSRPETSSYPKRHVPTRTASMDALEVLESELTGSPRTPVKREPRRKLAVTKSGTLHHMRTTVEKSHSADSLDEPKDAVPARRVAPTTRAPKKMMKAKSGSLHGLREAARRAQETNKDVPVDAPPTSPSNREPRRSRLVVTKSGTLHGMRKAVEKAKAEQDAPASPTKSPLRTSKFVATKSGTLHGMREAAAAVKAKSAAEKNSSFPVAPTRSSSSSRRPSDGSLQGSLVKGSNHALRTKKKERKASSANSSEDDSLSDFGTESGVESDVSLDTDEDVPKSPIKSAPKKKNGDTSSMSASKLSITKKLPENSKEENPTKPMRVFKNGKLVTIDKSIEEKEVGASEGTPSRVAGDKVSSAMDKFRNGSASPSELLRNMQTRPLTRVKSDPKKSLSVAQMASSMERGGVPPAFQQLGVSSAPRVRPGKIRIPSKAQSVSAMDIPPAFRTAGSGK